MATSVTVVVSGSAAAERLVRGLQPLGDRVLLRTDADDVVERRAQRALADAGHAAQIGDGDRFAEVVAQERQHTGDDVWTRDAHRRASAVWCSDLRRNERR